MSFLTRLPVCEQDGIRCRRVHLLHRQGNSYCSLLFFLTPSFLQTAQAKSFGATSVVDTSVSDNMKRARGTIDVLLVTVSADIPWHSYMQVSDLQHHPTMTSSPQVLRPGGILVLVGAPSGKIQIAPFSLFKNVGIVGSQLGSPNEVGDSIFQFLGHCLPFQVEEMLGFCAMHGILPQIETLPMSMCNEAIDRVRKNLPRFRIVLVNAESKL